MPARTSSEPFATTNPPDPSAALVAPILRELQQLRELLEERVKPLLTVAEVAALVGRDEYTVRRWVKEKRLPATRVTGTGPKGRLLIRREHLDQLLGGASIPTSKSAVPR